MSYDIELLLLYKTGVMVNLDIGTNGSFFHIAANSGMSD